MKILYILNPHSNGGKTRKKLGRIVELSQASEADFDVFETLHPRDAVQRAEEAACEYDVVVAIGGDGTVNEVAQGLYHARLERGQAAALGVISAGTGNDMIKGFGWPDDLDAQVDRVLHGTPKPIDIGMVDGHFFINIACVGFDAHVVMETDKIKHRVRSSMAYKLGIAASFFTYRNLHYRLAPEDPSEELFLVAVGNGQYYGGGFRILPQAKPDDGRLDICLVHHANPWVFLRCLPKVLAGTHGSMTKHIRMLRDECFEIDIDDPFLLNLDGENVRYDAPKRLRFEVVPGGLSLIQ